jgi:NADPH:quinone reductase-like Zn-dependent oxidoreductase
MKAARVTSWGSSPEYIDVADLPAPSDNELQLKVLAAGVPRVVKARASGKHPSSFNSPLPYDPSIDAVGLDEATGNLYFINSLAAPVFAERANVNKDQLTSLPAGADPVSVAALFNPTMSSWLALQCRAIGCCKGRTVAIIGATSASGRLAVHVARELGAARVVGLSRNEETLATVEGLDERVVLENPLTLPSSLGPIDIVLDYVGGPAGVEVMKVAEIARGQNLQYIQIGGLAGEESLVLPARLLNVRPIRVMASGIGSITMQELKREICRLVELVSRLTVPFEVHAFSMSDVHAVWQSEQVQGKRLVLIP